MELYIEPIRPNRDNRGRFVKGHKLRYERTVTEKLRESSLHNLEKAKLVVGKKGLNRGRPVVGIDENGMITAYPSASSAERHFLLYRGTIAQRCNGVIKNRIIAGRKWYWESDVEWTNLVQ